MADKNHQELASIIKKVHQTLRLEARKVGEENAWSQHCLKTEILQQYAQAMRQLATEYWDKNANDELNKKAISRVLWIAKQCEDYFFRGAFCEAFSKEILLCHKFNLDEKVVKSRLESMNIPDRLRVLDVGSCYNPFQKFPRFDVLAVDIAPASNDVFECDFLNLKVLDEDSSLKISGTRISELPEAHFDVVVFSLLLEYLPSCKQRYVCSSKASKLLTPGGILCIITPDSKHATANSAIMKKWKYALAHEGLLRIEYDKLPHLHCMVYRKCIHPTVSRHWLSSSIAADERKGKFTSDCPEQLMIIPQDCQPHTESGTNNVTLSVRDDDDSIASAFADLPGI